MSSYAQMLLAEASEDAWDGVEGLVEPTPLGFSSLVPPVDEVAESDFDEVDDEARLALANDEVFSCLECYDEGTYERQVDVDHFVLTYCDACDAGPEPDYEAMAEARAERDADAWMDRMDREN